MLLYRVVPSVALATVLKSKPKRNCISTKILPLSQSGTVQAGLGSVLHRANSW